MEKTIIELTEEDAKLFLEFQKKYYIIKPLLKKLEENKTKQGNITFHFTIYEEIASFDLIRSYEHVNLVIPI